VVTGGNGEFEVNYAGTPIAPKGVLTLKGISFTTIRQGTSQLYSDFTWTPGGETATPAPEPASWMLMTLGLGMLGGALRSRRRASGSLALA